MYLGSAVVSESRHQASRTTRTSNSSWHRRAVARRAEARKLLSVQKAASGSLKHSVVAAQAVDEATRCLDEHHGSASGFAMTTWQQQQETRNNHWGYSGWRSGGRWGKPWGCQKWDCLTPTCTAKGEAGNHQWREACYFCSLPRACVEARSEVNSAETKLKARQEAKSLQAKMEEQLGGEGEQVVLSKRAARKIKRQQAKLKKEEEEAQEQQRLKELKDKEKEKKGKAAPKA